MLKFAELINLINLQIKKVSNKVDKFSNESWINFQVFVSAQL